MKAFVLAAGVGARLRPLTSEIPKPMVPILGKPALCHTFENLKKYGFTDICVNLFHKAENITRYFANANTCVNLNYSREQKLLGTAGAVRKNADFFDDTFVVMSGDGLSDVNLKNILNFHKKKKALVTIALKKIDARFDYGITLTGKDGKVKSFVEKPFWKDVFANTVNTGIYVCEPEIFDFIPKNKFFDFGSDLFPLLLKNKKNVFGFVMNEYWTDIGNIFEYKKGVFDALDGKVAINISGEKKRSGFIAKNAKIDKSAKISRPCFIGNNVTVGKNAVLNPYSVLLDNVVVGKSAIIGKSIVWSGSVVGKNSKIDNTVAGYNSVIPDNINLFDSILMG
ncbi:sugar phosphate nucleotidyltransferase [Endomicrobium proavitum]|uniref:Mannose-1-phosphate guanyltransferase n=1 Tax=Endomicrobium proavitum TaxID=1408281 RepID=A0A0G3WJT4_9BACT|nr:NDP-sugar synthase [Endomicrobium proavitum]AKL97759.1 mannose-1-phosphate guanyltransferase [Endomicrobium proavitum]